MMVVKGIMITHGIPGRVRLKVARLKHNPSLAVQIRELLSNISGIQQVEANPQTASVLLLYDPDTIVSPTSLCSLLHSFRRLFPEVDQEELKAWLITTGGVFNATAFIARKISTIFRS